MQCSRRTMLGIIFLLCIWVTGTKGLIVGDPDFIEPIQEALAATMNGQFEPGIDYFRKMIDENATDPTGYYFLGFCLQSMYKDRESWDSADHLCAIFDSSIDLTRMLLAGDSENPWLWYLLGASYSHKSVLKFQSEGLWEGYSHIRKAVECLERSVEYDSTIYDAYLGLGGYYYLKSSKMSFLTWLPFISDDRAKGMDLLKLSSRKAYYMGDYAQHFLVHNYLEENCYNEAESLARDLLNRFPEGKTPWWDLMIVLLKQKKYEEGIETGDTLLKMLLKDPHQSGGNIIEAHYYVMEALYKTGQWERCLELGERLLAMPIDYHDRKTKDKEYCRIRDMVNELRSK